MRSDETMVEILMERHTSIQLSGLSYCAWNVLGLSASAVLRYFVFIIFGVRHTAVRSRIQDEMP